MRARLLPGLERKVVVAQHWRWLGLVQFLQGNWPKGHFPLPVQEVILEDQGAGPRAAGADGPAATGKPPPAPFNRPAARCTAHALDEEPNHGTWAKYHRERGGNLLVAACDTAEKRSLSVDAPDSSKR